MFGVRRRALEINAEMLEDLEALTWTMSLYATDTHYKNYLETRLMVLRFLPNTRENRRSIRAIRWLMEYVYGFIP